MTKDLTRGTPWKLILQFALPIMAGNLLQQLYNTADTIIVGNSNCPIRISAAAGNPTRPIWTSCLSPFKAVCLKS